jgi:catechol 2,3-dioxygenase-like lactoylglutathione lyase family enzyme
MILHADLFVDSMGRSLAFYRALGFEILDDAVIEGELVRYVSEGHYDAMRLVLLRASMIGSKLELLELLERSRCTTGPRPTIGAHPGALGVLVPDLAAALAQLRTLGVEPASPVRALEVPGVGLADTVAIDDPDGHALLLVQRSGLARAGLSAPAAPPR